jgi:hypothetical protein
MRSEPLPKRELEDRLHRAVGCAEVRKDYCTIWIVDDETLTKHRTDYEIVYRHERAHCNNWRHW